ncbi:glycosyltransferase family 39 protein [Candidatus Binatia bacterium]|nr:glycosyltransferase family 39 protein [Candidatus Binatia bacterium]
MSDPDRSGADLTAIFAVALVVRLLFDFLVYPEVAGSFGAGDGYDAIARNLVAGKGYVLDGRPAAAERLPLYPLLLAASFRFFGEVAWPWQAAQAVCGAATCALVLAMAQRYATRAGALAAAGMCALHPTLLLYTARPLTETLYTFLLVAFVREVSAPSWRPGRVGALWALQWLIKSTAMLQAVALIPAALRGSFAPLVRTVAVAVACLAPWVVVNLWAHGQANLFTATGGRALYHGLYIARHAGWTEPAADLNRDAEIALWADLARRGVARDAAVEMRDMVAGEEARAWIARNPTEAAALAARNVILTWYLGRSRLSMLVHGLLHGALLLAALVGAVRMWRRCPERRDLVAVAVLLIAAYTVFHAVVQPAVRYVLPVVPLVALLAAGATARGRRNASSIV